MRATNRRFAAARLAALPISEITDDLQVALRNLQEAPGLKPVRITDTVPGMDARVQLLIEPDFMPRLDKKGGAVFGNPADIKRLQEVDSPGVVSLEWTSDKPQSRGERVKVALHAQDMWENAIKDLPDGTIVMNEPVGARSGDFDRADIYGRAGFGVVQQDGMQYGIVQSGHIEPLSPFIPDEGHLESLARRAHSAGNTELEQSLNAALSRREANHIYEMQNPGFIYSDVPTKTIW